MDAQKAVRRGQVVVAGCERHNWVFHLHFAQKADEALCGANADADAALVIVAFAFPLAGARECVCVCMHKRVCTCIECFGVYLLR